MAVRVQEYGSAILRYAVDEAVHVWEDSMDALVVLYECGIPDFCVAVPLTSRHKRAVARVRGQVWVL